MMNWRDKKSMGSFGRKTYVEKNQLVLMGS